MKAISVLVATRNRGEKISACINSILNNSFTDFELIIIDQSSDNITKQVISEFNDKRIRYWQVATVGKSRALNFGLEKVKGKVIAFTDDDCVVDRRWMEGINHFFSQEPRISGLFGMTLPYQKEKHEGMTCPATYIKLSASIITDPYLDHYDNVGLGNNMSFRKNVFREIGKFKTWLGVGSIVSAGGIESELIYCVLKSGRIIAYNPLVVVYHNRWITSVAEKKLIAKYTCGLYAFYAYYWFRGDKKLIHGSHNLPVAHIWINLRSFAGAIIHHAPNRICLSAVELVNSFCYCLNAVKGILIGSWFALRNSSSDC